MHGSSSRAHTSWKAAPGVPSPPIILPARKWPLPPATACRARTPRRELADTCGRADGRARPPPDLAGALGWRRKEAAATPRRGRRRPGTTRPASASGPGDSVAPGSTGGSRLVCPLAPGETVQCAVCTTPSRGPASILRSAISAHTIARPRCGSRPRRPGRRRPRRGWLPPPSAASPSAPARSAAVQLARQRDHMCRQLAAGVPRAQAVAAASGHFRAEQARGRRRPQALPSTKCGSRGRAVHAAMRSPGRPSACCSPRLPRGAAGRSAGRGRAPRRRPGRPPPPARRSQPRGSGTSRGATSVTEAGEVPADARPPPVAASSSFAGQRKPTSPATAT